MADETRQAVNVPAGSNRISVRARGHQGVRLLQEGVALVEERSRAPVAAFVVAPGDYEVASDGELEGVEVDRVELPEAPAAAGVPPLLLELSSDAPDQHAVDGVGEVPVEGGGYCTVTVRSVAPPGGEPPAEADVYLRTTGGSLQDSHGHRVRSLKLRKGRASFRLVADAPPRLVTVMAFGDRSPAPATLHVEFV